MMPSFMLSNILFLIALQKGSSLAAKGGLFSTLLSFSSPYIWDLFFVLGAPPMKMDNIACYHMDQYRLSLA